VVASVLGGACASSGPASFAGRFIIPGTPAVDLSAPAAIAGPVAPAMPPVTPPPLPASPPAARTSVAATTLEATSPVLRARLDALAASPTPEAHLDVAAAYAGYGVHDRAYDHLAAGLVLHPTHAGLHEAVARLWRDWGLPDRALRHAHLAVRYAPESAAAQTVLGSVLWALDARDDATRAFARAFALEPAAAWARHNWCTAVAARGDRRPFACDTPYAKTVTPAGGAR
jgi:tetratricopeptide (TPR) repeat protein